MRLQAPESVVHILILCNIAAIAGKEFCMPQIGWTCPLSLPHFLIQWRGCCLPKEKKNIGRVDHLGPSGVNRRLCDDRDMDLGNIRTNILTLVFGATICNVIAISRTN